MFSTFTNYTESSSQPTASQTDANRASIVGQSQDGSTSGQIPAASTVSTPQPPEPLPPPDGPVYESLPPNSIRLLKLRPGHVTSPVECELITVSISEAPTYDALSYVWGLDNSPEPISCNGQQMPVRNNLILALRHLRPLPSWVAHDTWPESHALHSSHNAWKCIARNRNELSPDDKFQHNLIWIDSLCINQSDTAEREQQVKLMDRIFSRAETVKVWLGPADTAQVAASGPLNTEPAPTVRGGALSSVGGGVLNGVGGLLARERPVYHLLQYGNMPLILSFIAQALRNLEGGENRLAGLRPPWDLVHRNKAYGLLRPSADEWLVLRKFLSSSWFDRVWIVQEIVLARRAVVIVGDWQLAWTALGRAAAWFEDHGYAMPTNFKLSRTDMKDFLPVTKAAAVWRMYEAAEKRWPLLGMLRELRSRNATDARDKLYATYSMAQETEIAGHGLPYMLEPTYAKASGDEDPCLGVYRGLARFLVIEHGDLSVLSHVEQARVVRNGKWPSWVPDWRHGKLSTELSRHNLHQSLYNANAGETMVIGDVLDQNSLSVQGLRAAVVEIYSEKLNTYGLRHVTYQDECQFVRSAWNLYVTSLRGTAPTRGSVDMFISTLTAGLTEDERALREDSSFLPDAKAWLTENAPNVPLFQGSGTRWLEKKRKGWRDPSRFQEAFTRACSDRAFFTATCGLMGIGPNNMRVGDVVVVLFGGKVPYVLRPLGDGKYSFVGECYIESLMDGVVVRKQHESGSSAGFFCLV
ncbi:heterokaryon incompatibility protein [Colletotrichum sojae]|uniref:Heterokaryon incompatibility protein n=1 Tax=Colletotrichum sojae TaxID=2175907 RepID=A0A8H6JBY7_9PEZI|nr:heterokaryon incompatibility protein [Colletotrichum sojae]